ncbi:MAG TPA: hypothetical protein VMT15_09795 [Bryobacteraceae bacterium]|nr:hypothetical protein [Bryobacteraceae bacterium]
MAGTILIGAGREIRREPDDALLIAMEGLPQRMAMRLAFMTAEHHRVRDFVVRELPRQPRPLSAGEIAMVMGLDAAHVAQILADLEKHLFFLVRDAQGRVEWAFPVTTTPTRHRLTFSTGERISGA